MASSSGSAACSSGGGAVFCFFFFGVATGSEESGASLPRTSWFPPFPPAACVGGFGSCLTVHEPDHGALLFQLWPFPALIVVPVWSLAEWLPLQTFVADIMILQRCIPPEHEPALFLQLLWTLKKEQNH